MKRQFARRPSSNRRRSPWSGFESLEPRIALSGVQALNTISGQITNEAAGRGLGRVGVELLGSTGQIVATTHTGARGNYRFHVHYEGPYVIHAVTPKGFVQTSPAFSTSAPSGSYAINPATNEPYSETDWNYHTGNNNPANGPVGPAAWSTISPAGNLPFESPIDITGAPIDLSQYLTIHYTDAVPKTISNKGAQIQVEFDSSATDWISLDGQSYDLSQFHYHNPAENHVSGYTYPMEEHFVNVSASGAETVVAVFLQLGAYNPALQPILNSASAELAPPYEKAAIRLTAVDFAGLLPTNMMGWFYEGSLTTPPLSQTVNWLVLATPITLNYQQLQQYEAVAGDSGFLPSARPIQPLDGRQVNQFNIDVNFQSRPITGANFGFARNNAAAKGRASAF